MGFEIINGETETVDIRRIRPHPKNPNRGDVSEIEDSIGENGFYGFIGVQRSTGFVIYGNHRYRAAVAAGAQAVPVVWYDLTDRKALKILLVDNRLAEFGERDPERTAELLSSLAADDDLAGTGYDQADIDDLSELIERIAREAEEQEDGGAPPDPDRKKPAKAERAPRVCICPNCGYEFDPNESL